MNTLLLEFKKLTPICLIVVALGSFAFSPQLRAACDSPDPGCPGANLAEGFLSLAGLTTGLYNTGIGTYSLLSNAAGNFNTALGAGTLLANTASQNTAVGAGALFSNTTGTGNTATGTFALFSNTEGGFNTASGDQALFSNTTGEENTATGAFALNSNTEGDFNGAFGAFALKSNVDGSFNNAVGNRALFSNVHGVENTAIGDIALVNNDSSGLGLGNFNTAVGAKALLSNVDGDSNVAVGDSALFSNVDGGGNVAVGDSALFSNVDSGANVAVGFHALFSNTTGVVNTAIGVNALVNNTGGDGNIALGASAGLDTTGSNNIVIGNFGLPDESNTIRIGSSQTRTFIQGISGNVIKGAAVVVNASGELGAAPSSQRFKDEIKPMDKASEAILALKPVTFRYKQEIDSSRAPQFGLVAEDVERVNPDLLVRDSEGNAYSVRYDQVNAMLLNEFLKEHRIVEALEAGLAQQQKDFQAVVNRLEKQIETLTAGLQKVSAQLELSKSAPQTVLNNQ